jgi:hypothetical protein
MYTEKEMNRVIRQRDRAEEVVDKLKSMLGIKEKWSNHYGYEDFLEDAKSILSSDPSDKPDEPGICTHCGFPRKIPGEPCELCHTVD